MDHVIGNPGTTACINVAKEPNMGSNSEIQEDGQPMQIFLQSYEEAPTRHFWIHVISRCRLPNKFSFLLSDV